MLQQISLREANQHLSRYIESVESGNEVIITRRGLPIAKLLPISKKKQLTPEQKKAWERLHTKMHKGYNLNINKFDRNAARER